MDSSFQPTDFYQRLAKRFSQVGNCLCLGIDPDPKLIPSCFGDGLPAIENFVEYFIAETTSKCLAYKFNTSFFEAFGVDGIKLLEKMRRRISADVPVVMDAKRGDIGNTSVMQAKYLFDYLGADAVTLHPYMGLDSLEPFFLRRDRFSFVLVLTSNPGAANFEKQKLAEGKPLYRIVAESTVAWLSRFENVGMVVGATQESELAEIRSLSTRSLFLVPGVGTQGGSYDTVLSRVVNSDGLALINVGRAVMYPQAAAITSKVDWANSVSNAITNTLIPKK